MQVIASAITPKEYASRLGVSVPVVLAWLATGELSGLNVATKPGSKRKTWRIPASAILAFELKREARRPVAKASRRRQRKKDPGFVRYF